MGDVLVQVRVNTSQTVGTKAGMSVGCSNQRPQPAVGTCVERDLRSQTFNGGGKIVVQQGIGYNVLGRKPFLWSPVCRKQLRLEVERQFPSSAV